MQYGEGKDRFALAELTEFQLPDGTIALRNRSTGREMTLPVQVFNAISYCHAFRTLDEHVADLARGNPGAKGQEGTIRNILQSVVDAGLMQSAAEICQRLAPLESTPVPEKPTIAILTCDRPEALERLLRSIVENCELQSVDSIAIVDDSRREESIAKNASAIRELSPQVADRGTQPILHFDPAARAAFTDAIASRFPEAEVGIRFLIDTRESREFHTAGVAHNLCMLLSAGRPLVVFDDDVLCKAMEPPVTRPGIEFSEEPRGARFYASPEQWAEYVAENDRCPVRRLMRVLGQSLPSALHSLNNRPTPDSFQRTSLAFARALRPDCCIGVTQCGVFGDPGTGSNRWLATLNRESRDILLNTEGGLQRAMRQRNCWLGSDRPVIDRRANMSTVRGLDNRHYLPPQFPIGRIHDQLFGTMTAFVEPRVLAIDLPFAVPHLPIPERHWTAEDNRFAISVSPLQLIDDYIYQRLDVCRSRSAEVRNDWLALMFSDLATCPHTDLARLFESSWFINRASKILHLQKILDESSDSPAEWKEFLNGAMVGYRESTMPDFLAQGAVPQATRSEPETTLGFWSRAWRKFADGVRAWPGVRELAPQVLSDQVPNWSSASRE